MSTTPATLADLARHNGAPSGPEPDAPYVGLSYYTEADSALFFGRDGERQIIMGNLRASPLTLLYAQSGVGKSSLLRAGVAARLRQLAREALAGSGAAPQVPVVFSAWKDDPTQELIEAILAATNELLGERRSQLDLPRDSLMSAIEVAVLALDQAVASHGSERAGSTLLIILDQFEEYFLYRVRESRVERFADELAECINHESLHANFLISIREDAYSALGDLLRGRTSNVYGNYLHLEYLDAKAARAAIEKPLAYFNSLRDPDEQMSIEPGLVDAVLAEVKRDAEEQAPDGDAPIPKHPTRTEIAAPYLQLVMTALWQRERSRRSRVLRLSTLQELHGAESIVARHLSQALTDLSPADRELAVDVLHHLVTPSGTKVALEVADLSAYTGHAPERVAEILGALAGPARILREVPPAPGKSGEDEDARRFEIYHDVLAGPINDAVSDTATRRLQRQKDAAEARARLEQTRAFRFKMLAVAALVLLAAAVVAVFVAERARQQARSAQRTSHAREFAAEAQTGFLTGDLRRQVLMSVEAYRSDPSIPDARYALIGALETTQDMVGYLTGQQGQIAGVAYSPDGRMLASASVNRTVVLWNTQTQRQEAVLRTHSAELTGVAFSPDGTTVAASDAGGRITLWDARSHTVRRVLSAGDGQAVETLTFSPTGELLATAQQNGTARLWDSVSGRMLRTLVVAGGSHAVYGIAFSPSGKTLITGVDDGAVKLWDVSTGRLLRSINAGTPVNAVAINSADTLLGVAAGSRVLLYGFQTGQRVRSLDVGAGAIQTVAFSADGRMVAAGTAGSSGSTPAVAVWDTNSGHLAKLISAPNSVNAIYSVAFSPNGATLAAGGTTGGTDSSLILWNARPAPGFRLMRAPTPVNGVAYSPTERQLAVTGPSDKAVIWDVSSGSTRTVPAGGGGEGIAFSPDGRTLAVGADDHTITLFGATTGRRLRVLSGHADAVLSVAFSPDEKLLASGSADQRVIIWNRDTGKPLRVLSGHSAQINAVAFSPDGRLVASGGNDDVVDVWNVASGHRELTLTSTRPVTAVAFSPNGELLASAGTDQVVSLWQLSTGQLLGAPLAGHGDTITSLAFSRDGRHLVSGSGDRSALVWDVSSDLAVPIGGHTGGITSVALSPDGRTVASGGTDRTVTLVPIPSGMDAAAISQRLCGVVRRNLTLAEWRQLVPDEPYQRTCQP